MRAPVAPRFDNGTFEYVVWDHCIWDPERVLLKDRVRFLLILPSDDEDNPFLAGPMRKPGRLAECCGLVARWAAGENHKNDITVWL